MIQSSLLTCALICIFLRSTPTYSWIVVPQTLFPHLTSSSSTQGPIHSSCTTTSSTNPSISSLLSRTIVTKKYTRRNLTLFERVKIDPLDYPLTKDEAVWKAEGERIIKKAAVSVGAREEQLNIEWKSGRVIITVEGNIYIKGNVDDDEGVDISYDEDLKLEDTTFDQEDSISSNEESDDEDQGSDVVSIARAINSAFVEEEENGNSLGFSIAVHHEIEVTTPGASDELSGIMFESYRGFDVTVELIDAKTKKMKKVEGRLVERNDVHTVINQKGRMRKLKNELVQSVKLPKAKKEKGSR